MARRNHPNARPVAGSASVPATAGTERQMPTRKNVRANVAQLAARLIAEGQIDYRAAKQKAARQLGVRDSHALPDNHEIDLALREHFVLFARETQPRVLSVLRGAAVRAMARLEQFSPWLVGPVLNGTANEFSEIELELIAVEPKDFERHLLNAGIEFELCDAHFAKAATATCRLPATKYRLEFDGAPVTITLYDQHTARQAANPGTSIRHDRAQQADAERRFTEESARSSC